MATTTRQIEIFAGHVEPKEWFTFFVKIPADTPEDRIESLAVEQAEQELTAQGTDVAFVGVYWIPEIDEDLGDE
jgi:hypothetical protein